jgi:quercetin dioxygenase-like cupin family protein
MMVSKSRQPVTGRMTMMIRNSKLAHVILAFVMGILVGRRFFVRTIGGTTPTKTTQAIVGSIHHLQDTPIRNTSHKDEQGRPITKQQFLEPFAIPTVAGVSVATILPGQRVEMHQHESMHEFFYILQGTGMFSVLGTEEPVAPGTFLHLAPHEPHGIWVPEHSPDGAMKVLLSGVAILVE